MSKLLRLVAGIAALSLLAIAGSVSGQDALPRFEAGDCAFTPPSGVTVECGTVFVPENYAAPDESDLVGLAVAVYRTSSEATSDPVFFLQGGPGGGIVANINFYYSSMIAPINGAGRDFVVFDQRGTGLSTPALNCPEITALLTESLRQDYTPEAINPLYIEAFTTCGERLRAEGVDLAQYTSPASATDITQIADALGYDSVTLYGGSYGTRLAQTAMRDYPDRVSSVIMDGVLGIADNQIGIIASKSDWALDNLFARCASDAGCAAAYPDLENTFYSLVEGLQREPIPVTVTIPTTGEVIETTADGAELVSGVFFALQQTTLIPTVPQTIASVAAGDSSPLSTFLTIPVLLGDTINIGSFLSVVCAEEIPATTPAALDAELTAYPRLAPFTNTVYYGGGAVITEICNDWGAASFDPIEGEAITSDIPTLLFSGAFDPATPSYFADAVAENLSTSYNYVIEGAGHVASPLDSCAMSMIVEFLNDPTTEPTSACLSAASFAFNTPSTEIVLVPITNETFGYSAVIPEGWSEVSPGTYAENASSSVALILQALPAPIDQVKSLLAAQLGLEPFPDMIETFPSEGESGLTWERYEAAILGQNGDLAFANDGTNTYLVILISTPATRDLYFNGLFVPLLDALMPN